MEYLKDIDGSIKGSLCPDGTPRVIKRLQWGEDEPPQFGFFVLDCPRSAIGLQKSTGNISSSAGKTTRIQTLEHRQSCGPNPDCSSYAFCRSSTAGFEPPIRNDCRQLTEILRQRGITNSVEPLQQLYATYGTCAYLLTNQSSSVMTWCDFNWAIQCDIISQYCLPSTYPGFAGGFCMSDGVRMDVYNLSSPPPASSTSSDPTPSTSSTTLSASASRASTVPSISAISSATTTTTTTTTTTIITTTPSTTLSIPLPGTNNDGSNSGTFSEPTTVGVTQNNDSNEPSGVSQKPQNMTAVIAGSVIGVAIVILALLLFWIWRRKRYKVVEETLPFEEPYPIPRDPKVSELPMSEVSLSPSDLQLPPGAFSPKMVGLPVSRRPFTPIDHPSAAASAEPLINTSPSNGQNANSNPSNLEARPIEIDGLVPPPGSADNNNNDYAPPLPRQSMSARMLAQALAPNLSENDLDRLAESIVARMQVTTVPPAEHGDVSHLGRLGSEVGSPEARGEPPPAWRSSWGSTGQPLGPLRRPDSLDPTRVSTSQ